MLLNFGNSSGFQFLTECKSAIIFCSNSEVPQLTTGSGSSSFSKGERTFGVFSNLRFLMFFYNSEGPSKLGFPMVDPIKVSWNFYKSKPRLGFFLTWESMGMMRSSCIVILHLRIFHGI